MEDNIGYEYEAIDHVLNEENENEEKNENEIGKRGG